MSEREVALTTVMIRNMDAHVWTQLRAEARRRRWDTAALVEQMWRAWVADQETTAVAS